METVTDFILGGSKITADCRCSHGIKRHLLLGRKVITNLDSILKSRDITLPTKVRLVKAIKREKSCDIEVGVSNEGIVKGKVLVAQSCSCLTLCDPTEASVQFSHSVMSNSATPWTTTRQASLSIINSWSLLKLMSIASVMPSNHLILCRPLLLPPSIFPSIRVFQFNSVQFSRSVMSDSLRPHELQHARPPCPSPTPGVH